MKKACASAARPMGVVTLLSVGLIEEDHASLADILKYSECDQRAAGRWKLNACSNLPAALAALRKDRVPVVVCETDLQPGTWKEVLEELRTLPDPPFLIVTSKFADERLWAEALNLGAWDVLAQPFDNMEVTRIVNMAWQRWENRLSVSGGAMHAEISMASGM